MERYFEMEFGSWGHHCCHNGNNDKDDDSASSSCQDIASIIHPHYNDKKDDKDINVDFVHVNDDNDDGCNHKPQ